MHSTFVQLGAVRQARSWQSTRPLPSSSLPFAHCSGVVDEPVDSVRITLPGVLGYDWTMSQYVPAPSAGNVCVAVGLSPAFRHVTGLRSQAWLAAARKRPTTGPPPLC